MVWAEAVTPEGRFVLRASKRNHRGWFEPRGPDDPNLVDRPCVLVQRTTAKEQNRRLIVAEMPASLFNRHRQVAVENHLNMVRPMQRRPPVPLHVVAAFLATDIADRVLRCINASVAVSASELEAIPLPGAAEDRGGRAGRDFEAAVQPAVRMCGRREIAAAAAVRGDPRPAAGDLSRRHAGPAFLIREATARTVFVALYVGAVEGEERWIAPRHVVRMSSFRPYSRMTPRGWAITSR